MFLGASVRRNLALTVAVILGLGAPPFAGAQADAPLKFNCVIRDAQILPDRTVVRCANKGLNGLSEFAAETNQPYANRVAAAIVQALRSGSPLILTYAPSAELNPDGCPIRNCRKIIDVGGNGRIVKPPAPPPTPLNAPEPQVEPADFDPVEMSVDEPGPSEGVAAIAPSAPAPIRPPAAAHRPMEPIPN